MDYFTRILESRCSRANLDTTKSYIKVQKVDGKLIEEEVGQFVKTYRMGSGDGMTLHWEFTKDGLTISVGDSMWGSINGSELIGFRAVE
jgi:hypothetical protein